MTTKEALELVRRHVNNEGLVRHMIAAGIIMRALAKTFGEDEDLWELAGVLHDIDWEETASTPEKHPFVGVEYLKATDCPPEVIEAIRVHNHTQGTVPTTLLEKALFCAEELTGIIVACALVQPDKTLASVKPESVLKKFKQPSFAAGVNREIISRCQEMLGLSLEELIEIELTAMQERAGELGL